MIDYIANILANVAIFGVITLGLDVQWGWAGLLDLTYFSFAACGAYTYAVFAMPPHAPTVTYILGLSWPVPLSILMAMVVTGVFAAVVGAVALKRLRPEYLAIVTLSLGLLLMQIVTQVQGFLDGTDGLFGIPAPLPGSLAVSSNAYPVYFLVLCLVVVAICTVVLQRLHKSGFGRAVRAVRDSDAAAQAFGYNAFDVKLKAFVTGAVFAGLGGALLAGYLTAFNTGAWAPAETFLLFVAVLIGGRGRPVGVLVGVAIVSGGLQEATRYLPEIPGHPGGIAALRLVLIGVLMIVAVRLRPQGMLPERPSVEFARVPQPSDEPAVSSGARAAALPVAVPRPAVPAEQLAAVALEVSHVSKSFGGVHAVRDASFRVRSRSITGLIGPNGAGKSTMVEIISGFLVPDSGSVSLDGRILSGRSPHSIARQGVCRTFQVAREWGSMTVFENLLVAGAAPDTTHVFRSLLQTRSYHTVVSDTMQRAATVLEQIGLARMASTRAGSLSGGQRRLLDFGRILMAEPKLVLLDEPLAGVNPTLHPVIADAIRGLRSSGITVVLIEHNLDFVDELCDEAVVMAEGTPIAQGTLADLRRDARVVDAYLGQVTIDA